jgi:cation diffusion facilitator family transporter
MRSDVVARGWPWGAPPALPGARVRLRAMVWSLCFAALLLGVKFAAFAMTQSNAVLSDALESIVNVAASGFALYTIWIAIQPADASHPYGHGKAEAFSAGFEGGLIVLAGAAILWQATPALWSPAPLRNLDAGLVLVAAAGAVNLGLGYFLIRTARRTGSLALLADGHHVLSDSLTTAGVLIGLAVVRITGWAWVDPVVAIVIALHLLRVGTSLALHAVASLMDQADPAVLSAIAAALHAERRPEWVEVHKLRSWRAGDTHHVDFHLTLPRFWDLEQAHGAEHAVAEVVHGTLAENADVIVHLDPCVPACCGACGYEPCPVRAAPFAGAREWTARLLVQTAQFQRTQAGPAPESP